MESLMQPVSLNNFFKCYPWRVHALQLVFLAAVILILFLRYGFWGPQAADAFTVLRESSPVITAFMNGISDWGNAALDSVYAAILIRSFLTRDREGILFSLGYAAMAILYLGVTLQLVKYGLGMPRPGVPWPPHPWSCHEYTSFPSGHTAHVIAATLPLAFWFRSGILRLCLSLLIGFMGFSRVWLGAHHPVDLLGGLFFGSLGVMCFYYCLFCADPKKWKNLPALEKHAGKELIQ